VPLALPTARAPMWDRATNARRGWQSKSITAIRPYRRLARSWYSSAPRGIASPFAIRAAIDRCWRYRVIGAANCNASSPETDTDGKSACGGRCAATRRARPFPLELNLLDFCVPIRHCSGAYMALHRSATVASRAVLQSSWQAFLYKKRCTSSSLAQAQSALRG
jgi:hypothetical protein